MGIIDWIMLGILLIFAVQGFRKGLAAALVQIVAAVAVFLLWGQFYPLVRNSLVLNFKLHGVVATLVALVLIIVLMLVIVRILIFLLNRLLRAVNLSLPNKFLGLVFNLINGLLCLFVVMVLLDYAPKLSTPLKDPARHRVYSGVNTLKEDLISQLKLKQRDKYLELRNKVKRDKEQEPAGK